MKRLFFLCLAIPFLQCKDPKEGVNKSPELKTGVNSEWLLGQYENISFDTLNLYASDKPEDKSYPFKGRRLDSLCLKFFPRDFAATYSYDSNFYACFKFPIDDRRTGLITRTPSDYESSIKLLIFDKKADSVVSYIELADLLADAGDVTDMRSFLFNNHTKGFDCLIWEQNQHDNSVNNAKDTTVESSDNYYLISLSKQGLDTVSKDPSTLSRRFAGLLKPGR